jgi:4-hydroxy-tetrahydrodipicolinate reductase
MIRVAITGINGRMGTMITDIVLAQPDMELVAGFNLSEGRPVGKIKVAHVRDMDRVLKATKPDVLIDFTVAQAAVENVRTAAANGVGLVVGTTGFDEAQKAAMKQAIEAGKVAAIISPNYSVGVQVFLKLLREAARRLDGDCDIEIVEAHHNKKRDAPSGTALKAADVIASALKEKPPYVYGREGVAPRGREIGIHAVRGGDIVGDHTVLFACEGERIEIKHQAHSRQAFASGAVKAARWIVAQKPGLYSMDDMFN